MTDILTKLREEAEKFGIKLFRHGQPDKGVRINGLWFEQQIKELEDFLTEALIQERKATTEEAIKIGAEWRADFNRMVIPEDKKQELIGFEKGIVWYQGKLKEFSNG